MFWLAKWSLFSWWLGGGSGIFWDVWGWVCIGLVELQKLIDYNIILVSYFLEVFVLE